MTTTWRSKIAGKTRWTRSVARARAHRNHPRARAPRRAHAHRTHGARVCRLSIAVLSIAVPLTSLRAQGPVLINFLGGKANSFLFATNAAILLKFYLQRKKQMKPSREDMNDEMIRQKWDKAGKGAPRTLWNTFHGEDKYFEDLPLKPPDYSYGPKCCEHVGTYDLAEDVWTGAQIEAGGKVAPLQPLA